MPTDFYDALSSAYTQLAENCSEAEPSVAVRSSAIDEDGKFASFAGQYETFLNITGIDAVAKSITDCWASMRSERVMDYRSRYGLSVEECQIAVLVQQLVPPDVSAVVFSANPVKGSREFVRL